MSTNKIVTPESPSAPPLKCIIQTRVSTDSQEFNTSHETQHAAGLKKAAEMGADVVAVFHEEVSGALLLARPDIQKSLSMIEAGEANVLIFAKLDRAGRDVEVLRAVRRRIEQAGGQLVFADGLSFQSGAVGDLMFTQLGAFAEFERAVIRERTTAGLRARASEGKQVARARHSYGYKIWCKPDAIRGLCTNEQVGTYEIVEAEARWVREMFRLCAEGSSLDRITWHLIENRVPTKRGGLWTRSTVRRMLRHSLYKGVGRYGQTKRMVDESRASSGRRIDYHVATAVDLHILFAVPPIVDEATWNLVQKRLDGAREKSSGNPRHRRALSGLLRCPYCNAILRSLAANGYRYYRCPHAPLSARDSRASAASRRGEFLCRRDLYNEEYVFNAVVAGLVGLLRRPEIIAMAGKAWAHEQKQVKGSVIEQGAKRRLKIESELERLSKREEAAAESRVEAKINGQDTSPYDRLLKTLAAQREALEHELSSLQAPPRVAPPLELPRMPDADKFEAVLRSSELNGATKHQILATVVEAIYPRMHGVARGPRSHRYASVQIVLRSLAAQAGLAYLLTVKSDAKSKTQGNAEGEAIQLHIVVEEKLPGWGNEKGDDRHKKERWKNPLA